VPILIGSPRRTAAEILAIWPSATMIIDNSGWRHLYVLLKEWVDTLSTEPPYPTENDLDNYDNDYDQWWEHQYYNRVLLHLATDEWMPVEVAEQFGIPDKNWGIDYDPVEYLFPIDKQEGIEQSLRDLGFNIVRGELPTDGPCLDRWLP
jgi:hypothetical protein